LAAGAPHRPYRLDVDPGLAAKPIIDIQVSVAEFEPMDALAAAMAGAGYEWRALNPELTKRYFRERPGEERTHIRREGKRPCNRRLPGSRLLSE
jgi:GrpB-like predicted nucleotidyltransferase (UPF0157 family)